MFHFDFRITEALRAALEENRELKAQITELAGKLAELRFDCRELAELQLQVAMLEVELVRVNKLVTKTATAKQIEGYFERQEAERRRLDGSEMRRKFGLA
jgi:hypothetical protein